MLKIEYSDFNLLCLKCTSFDGYALDQGTKMNARVVYDYEIEFFIKSDGGIEIDGEYVPFEAGSINFRKPGQVVRGKLPYSCYVVCVDLVGNKNKKSENYDFGSPDFAQPVYENPLLNAIGDKISSENNQLLSTIMKSIYENYFIHNEFIVKMLLYQLLIELYISATKNKPSPYPSPIQKAIKYMKNNFSKNISMDEVSQNANLSINYFHNIFKKYVGVTPNNFLMKLRIDHAKYLLSMTDLPVSVIGEKCGIYDAVYFSYLFKKHVGITANAYRKNPYQF